MGRCKRTGTRDLGHGARGRAPPRGRRTPPSSMHVRAYMQHTAGPGAVAVAGALLLVQLLLHTPRKHADPVPAPPEASDSDGDSDIRHPTGHHGATRCYGATSLRHAARCPAAARRATMSCKMALSCLVVLAGCASAAAYKCESDSDCQYWGCVNRGYWGETVLGERCREGRCIFENLDQDAENWHKLLCPEPLFLVVAPLGTLLFLAFFPVISLLDNGNLGKPSVCGGCNADRGCSRPKVLLRGVWSVHLWVRVVPALGAAVVWLMWAVLTCQSAAIAPGPNDGWDDQGGWVVLAVCVSLWTAVYVCYFLPKIWAQGIAPYMECCPTF